MKKETARSYTIHFDQQEGMTTADWKSLVYDLFRLNMTWNCFYRIAVNENRSGVVAEAVVRKAYEPNFKEWLYEHKINFTDDKVMVGVIDWQEDVDIDYVYMS